MSASLFELEVTRTLEEHRTNLVGKDYELLRVVGPVACFEHPLGGSAPPVLLGIDDHPWQGTIWLKWALNTPLESHEAEALSACLRVAADEAIP